MSTSLGIGESGFAARLVADTTLADLVGVDEANEVRVFHGWPAELLNRDDPPASEFPRVTFLRTSSLKAAKGSGDLVIQVDIWVYPGDKELLEDIDSRILDLVDEEWWVQDGVRLSGRAIGGESDTPAAPGRPMRRRRDIWIGVN